MEKPRILTLLVLGVALFIGAIFFMQSFDAPVSVSDDPADAIKRSEKNSSTLFSLLQQLGGDWRAVTCLIAGFVFAGWAAFDGALKALSGLWHGTIKINRHRRRQRRPHSKPEVGSQRSEISKKPDIRGPAVMPRSQKSEVGSQRSARSRISEDRR